MTGAALACIARIETDLQSSSMRKDLHLAFLPVVPGKCRHDIQFIETKARFLYYRAG